MPSNLPELAFRKSLHVANRIFAKSAGGDARPAFFDVDKTFPALRILDQNYEIIRAEMEGVLSDKHKIPRYHELSERETYISATVNPEKDWRVFMLATLAGVPPSSQARCPKTTALIQQIPGMFGAFFSILDAGKSIPAHCGPYLGYLRYHLGLRIPKDKPPRMRVRDEVRTWQEGQSFVFDDSHEHEVYNESDEIRVILIVDFFRPMPFPLHALNWSLYQVAALHADEGKGVLDRIEKYSAEP
jgi:aspartate beta-hydroxylase/beta-hydroxylase